MSLNGIDVRVGGVAGELDQVRAGGEADVLSVRLSKPASPRLLSSVTRELTRSKANRPLVVDPALGVVAAAVGVAGVEQPRELRCRRAVADAQRVAAAVLGEVAVVAELLAVEVDRRVARHHQHVGVGDVVERERLEDVVVVDELHARRAVVQAVVGEVECWRS